MRHTFAHELFHAAGLMLHTELHDRLTNQGGSPARDEGFAAVAKNEVGRAGHQKVQEWTCRHCGYKWKRTTVRRPTRCMKCARPW